MKAWGFIETFGRSARHYQKPVTLRHKCLTLIDLTDHIRELNAVSRGSCVGSIADPDKAQSDGPSGLPSVPPRKHTPTAYLPYFQYFNSHHSNVSSDDTHEK
jgi:hypothetical protein